MVKYKKGEGINRGFRCCSVTRRMRAVEQRAAGIGQHHQDADGDDAFRDLEAACLPYAEVGDVFGVGVAAQAEHVGQAGKNRAMM